MSRIALVRFGLVLAMVLRLFCQDAHAQQQPVPLAQVPPMGFNDWARFQCTPQAPLNGGNQATYSFQQFMEDQGQALYDSGLSAVGYRTVVVDDCWMVRNSAGYLHGDPKWAGSSQPGFDYELTSYMSTLHNLGLLGGVYNTAGAATCQGAQAGAQGHQQVDANSYAYWGVDFLKLDNCGATGNVDVGTLDKQMQAALKTEKRPILFDPSLPAGYSPDQPEKYPALALAKQLGQMWRVSADIKTTNPSNLVDPWDYYSANAYEEGVYQSYDDTIALSRYMAPGSWNDADQLVIGDNGLSTAEERSQLGLWSIMGAPLILSTDVRKLVNPTTTHLRNSLEILSNKSVVAINQDPLGAGGYRVMRDNPAANAGFDVIVKPLKDGSLAALVLNKGSSEQAYTLQLASLGLSPAANGRYSVRDLWNGTTQSSVTSVTQTIGSHDNLMLRIQGGGKLVPTGQIQTTQPGFATPALCLSVAGGAKSGAGVVVDTCSNAAVQQWQRQANGTISLAGTSLCLSANATAAPGSINPASGLWATLNSCNARDTKQVFGYTLTGNLKNSQGCLDVFEGTVSTAGTPVDIYQCAADATPQVNQIWSAPHGSKL